MPDVSWKNLARFIVSAFFVVVVTYSVSILVTEAGFTNIARTMAVIAGILSAILSFNSFMNTADSGSSNPNQDLEFSQESLQPQPPRKPPEKLTNRERVQRMDADDN